MITMDKPKVIRACPRCKGLIVSTYDEWGSIVYKQTCYYISCVNCGWVQYNNIKEDL